MLEQHTPQIIYAVLIVASFTLGFVARMVWTHFDEEEKEETDHDSNLRVVSD